MTDVNINMKHLCNTFLLYMGIFEMYTQGKMFAILMNSDM